MKNLLIRSLTKISNKVIKVNTGSMYFIIRNIKVRVSDHMSVSTDADLAIIKTTKEYVVFPLKTCNNKKIMTFSNVNSVINFVKQYTYFYEMFIMLPGQIRKF